MKAKVARIVKEGQIDIIEEDVKYGPRDIVIRSDCIGLSLGTDLTLYKGLKIDVRYGWCLQYPWPIASGDTGVGEVIAIGKNVTKFKEGDRVITTGGLRSIHVQNEQTIAVPENMDIEAASFLHHARIALNAVRRARIVLGDSVLVIGQGTIGILCTQLAKLAGGEFVIAADLYKQKLALAEQVGTDAIIDASSSDIGERTLDLTNNRGVDIIIDTSGSSRTLGPAMSASKFMARIVIVGWISEPVQNLILGDEFHFKQLEIISSQIGFQYPGDINHSDHWTPEHNYNYLFQIMKKEKLKVKEIITHRIPLDRVTQIFEIALKNPAGIVGVLVKPNCEKEVDSFSGDKEEV